MFCIVTFVPCFLSCKPLRISEKNYAGRVTEQNMQNLRRTSTAAKKISHFGADWASGLLVSPYMAKDLVILSTIKRTATVSYH